MSEPTAYRARDDSYRDGTAGEWILVDADLWTRDQIESLRHIGWKVEPLYATPDPSPGEQGGSDG